jgi:hypothetical protein
MLSRDAGLYFIDQHVQAFGRKPSSLAHAGEGFGAVNLDLPGFTQRRTGCIDICHGVSGVRGGLGLQCKHRRWQRKQSRP